MDAKDSNEFIVELVLSRFGCSHAAIVRMLLENGPQPLHAIAERVMRAQSSDPSTAPFLTGTSAGSGAATAVGAPQAGLGCQQGAATADEVRGAVSTLAKHMVLSVHPIIETYHVEPSRVIVHFLFPLFAHVVSSTQLGEIGATILGVLFENAALPIDFITAAVLQKNSSLSRENVASVFAAMKRQKIVVPLAPPSSSSTAAAAAAAPGEDFDGQAAKKKRARAEAEKGELFRVYQIEYNTLLHMCRVQSAVEAVRDKFPHPHHLPALIAKFVGDNDNSVNGGGTSGDPSPGIGAIDLPFASSRVSISSIEKHFSNESRSGVRSVLQALATHDVLSVGGADSASGSGGSGGSGSVRLNYRSVCDKLRQQLLWDTVFARHGPCAVRILRLLHEKHTLEDTTIAEEAMITQAAARTLLSAMVCDNFVSITEIPRFGAVTAERLVKSSSFLWSAAEPAIAWDIVKRGVVKGIRNAKLLHCCNASSTQHSIPGAAATAVAAVGHVADASSVAQKSLKRVLMSLSQCLMLLEFL